MTPNVTMTRRIETYEDYCRRTDERLRRNSEEGFAGGPGIVDWIREVIQDWVAGLWESRDVEDRVRSATEQDEIYLNQTADAIENISGSLELTKLHVTRAETSLKGATAEFAKAAANLQKAKAALEADPENAKKQQEVQALFQIYQSRKRMVERMTGLVTKIKSAYQRGLQTKDKSKVILMEADTRKKENQVRGQELIIEDNATKALEGLNDITAGLAGLSIRSKEARKGYRDSLDKIEESVAKRRGKAEGRSEANDLLVSQQANAWLGEKVDLSEIDEMLKGDDVLAKAKEALEKDASEAEAQA